MSPTELSLVFPAHNEQANIGRTIRVAQQTAARFGFRTEIIVVDDGSTDQTVSVAASFPSVRLLQHPINRGYGAALRTGFSAAVGTWVFFTDADLQFDLSELEDALAVSAGCDMVVGYRDGRQDPLHRRVNARAWGLLVRSLFGVAVRDVNCAFKLIRRRLLSQLQLSSEGAFINTELLVRARSLGCTIRELPVRHYPRQAGAQSGNRPDVVMHAFRELGQLWHLRHEPESPLGPGR